MDQRYRFSGSESVITPALVVFRDLVAQNLDGMIRIAGDPRRLRPHCKTHKMRQVIQMQLEAGINKFKAATFAEAEMLADAGAGDIFLAYSLVGANLTRAVVFRRRYPDVTFSVTADHPRPIAELGEVMSRAELTIEVLLDLDTGQHRTGIAPGERAGEVYRLLSDTAGIVPGGLHLYDGQNHQTDLAERATAVMAGWEATRDFRDQLVTAGQSVPRIVAGGTGSFPVFAGLEDPTLELSPGTCIFQDAGYGQMFPDLDFVPAALLLTRVISRPTTDRLTLDLGYKAVASDPPADRRVVFPSIPDAELVLQNEEHLVVRTSQAESFEPGDELLAIPRHICPTSALHKDVVVVEDGKVTDRWEVVARDRRLTI